MRGEPYHDFIDDFFGFLEQRGLLGGGFGGRSRSARPKASSPASSAARPTEEDREAVVDWLRARPGSRGRPAKDFKTPGTATNRGNGRVVSICQRGKRL